MSLLCRYHHSRLLIHRGSSVREGGNCASGFTNVIMIAHSLGCSSVYLSIYLYMVANKCVMSSFLSVHQLNCLPVHLTVFCKKYLHRSVCLVNEFCFSTPNFWDDKTMINGKAAENHKCNIINTQGNSRTSQKLVSRLHNSSRWQMFSRNEKQNRILLMPE